MCRHNARPPSSPAWWWLGVSVVSDAGHHFWISGNFSPRAQLARRTSVSMKMNDDARHPWRRRLGVRVHEQYIGLARMSVAQLVGDGRVGIVGQGFGIIGMIEDDGMVVARGKF